MSLFAAATDKKVPQCTAELSCQSLGSQSAWLVSRLFLVVMGSHFLVTTHGLSQCVYIYVEMTFGPFSSSLPSFDSWH